MDGNDGVLVGAILPLMRCCHRDWHMLFFNLQQPHSRSFLQGPDKPDNCLISSLSKAAMPKAHSAVLGLWITLSGDGLLKDHLAQSQWGCFHHSFPFRLILASNTVSCWDLPVTPEIQMGSTLLDGLTLHCAPLLSIWHARWLNPHSPLNPVVPLLHLAGDRTPLVLVIVFITRFFKNESEITSRRPEVREALLICLGNGPLETGVTFFLTNPFCDFFS